MSQPENETQLPASLESVALIDAKTAAAVGCMSLSWWHAEVAAGRAPRPAIQQPRCTRWRLQEVRDFWARRAARPNEGKAEQVASQAKRASDAAKAKRESAGVAQ